MDDATTIASLIAFVFVRTFFRALQRIEPSLFILLHVLSLLPSIYEPRTKPTSLPPSLLIDGKSFGTRVTTSPHETLSAAFPAAEHHPLRFRRELVMLPASI